MINGKLSGKEKANQRAKQWYWKNIDRKKEYDKKYWLANREEIIEQREPRKEEKSQYNKNYYQINKDKENGRCRNWYHSINGKYSQYKRTAKNRKRKFELTKEDFMEYWQEPCVYCGSEIQTIGLDRVDNNIGYIKENIVSCCEFCNRIKINMSADFFIEHCKKIVEKSYNWRDKRNGSGIT